MNCNLYCSEKNQVLLRKIIFVMKKYCCAIFILLLFSACAPSRFVKPLSKGEKAINVSLGGPLIAFSGLVIPIPLTTITGGYGLTQNTTIFGSWHTTSALFQTGQTEIGIVKQIISQKNFIPALSTNVVGNFIFNKNHFNVYPQVDINAYWHYLQKKNFFYIGINNWFELQQTRTHQETQTDHWLLSPQIGHTFVHNTWQFTLECKYVALNKSHENLIVDYKSTSTMGAIGLYFGISKKF
ncbi:MAG: hypothetical protein RL060_202 [Bacteroidota bacterium]